MQTSVLVPIWGFFITAHDRSSPNLADFGRAFTLIRTERAVEVSQLARASGVAARRIRELEAGRLDPDYALLVALAEALDVWPSAFVTRAEALADEESRR